jgi:hypothetical protein
MSVFADPMEITTPSPRLLSDTGAWAHLPFSARVAEHHERRVQLQDAS